MRPVWLLCLTVILCTTACLSVSISPTTPKRWGPVTLAFEGPATSESADPNPFTDYRLDVLFTHKPSAARLVVPGYYAADGNAEESSATDGNVWHVKFAPPRVGDWSFEVSFRRGKGIAMANAPKKASEGQWAVSSGEPVSFNGESGTLFVREQDAKSPDLRAHGRLQYVGQRYFRFAGGKYFLKLGTNTPENLLSFTDFDGDAAVLPFDAHVRDWRAGDPTWGGRGKGLVGAFNYLSSMRVNSFFAILFTVRGDSDPQVHPYTARGERYRFDVSKLAQWRVVFEHAQERGIAPHLAFCETENEGLWEHEEGLSVRTGFAASRKLYYREMVARFAHLLGMVFMLGEENGWDESAKNGGGSPWGKGNTPEQRRKFTQYIRALDPYAVPISVHTFPELKEEVYGPMLGPNSGARVEAASLQFGQKGSVYRETRYWVSKSDGAGKPWIVSADEFGRDPGSKGAGGVPLTRKEPLAREYRTMFAWGNIMAGGAGIEVFNSNVDQKLHDFRAFDSAWRDFSRPLALFNKFEIPFWTLSPWTTRVKVSGSSGKRSYVLGNEDDLYVVYREAPMRLALDVSGLDGKFQVRWFDPRMNKEEKLLVGSVSTVSAASGGNVDLGKAPFDDWSDWVVVVSRSFPITQRMRWLVNASPRDLIPGSLMLGDGARGLQWEPPLA